MQNHLEMSSKTQFWTRNVRNWSKSLTESLRKVYGTYNLTRRTHKGPYGPIYGPIWAPARTGPQPGLGPNPARAQVSRPALGSLLPDCYLRQGDKPLKGTY